MTFKNQSFSVRVESPGSNIAVSEENEAAVTQPLYKRPLVIATAGCCCLLAIGLSWLAVTLLSTERPLTYTTQPSMAHPTVSKKDGSAILAALPLYQALYKKALENVPQSMGILVGVVVLIIVIVFATLYAISARSAPTVAEEVPEVIVMPVSSGVNRSILIAAGVIAVLLIIAVPAGVVIKRRQGLLNKHVNSEIEKNVNPPTAEAIRASMLEKFNVSSDSFPSDVVEELRLYRSIRPCLDSLPRINCLQRLFYLFPLIYSSTNQNAVFFKPKSMELSVFALLEIIHIGSTSLASYELVPVSMEEMGQPDMPLIGAVIARMIREALEYFIKHVAAIAQHMMSIKNNLVGSDRLIYHTRNNDQITCHVDANTILQNVYFTITKVAYSLWIPYFDYNGNFTDHFRFSDLLNGTVDVVDLNLARLATKSADEIQDLFRKCAEYFRIYSVYCVKIPDAVLR